MNAKSPTSWRRSRGLTLVEALVGSAVLGGVLVGLVLSQSRLAAQDARSVERLDACRLADQMLATWWPDRAAIPRNADGEVPDAPGWRWQTATGDAAPVPGLTARVVRLTLYAPQRTTPAVEVEVLVLDDV